MALSRLITLFFSSLRILNIEANEFYDRAHRRYDAALFTRCYSQHALRPYIDSEINHIGNFIKVQFVNKGIEFINLPNIIKGKYVINSMGVLNLHVDNKKYILTDLSLHWVHISVV